MLHMGASFLPSEQEVRTHMDSDADNGMDSGEDTAAEETQSTQETKQPTLDEVLGTPEAQEKIARMVQSEADKRFARHLAKQREDSIRSQQTEAQRRAEAEEQELLNKGDFESYGRTAAQRRAIAVVEKQAIEKVAAAIENAFKTDKTIVAEIGEDRIAELWDETYKEQGDVIDYMQKLLGERQTRTTKKEIEKARKELEEEFEAKLKEAGVEVRSKNEEEGKAPVEAIAKGTPATGMTDTQLIAAYADGRDVDMGAVRKALKRQGIEI